MNLSGKHIVITGAASGIGAALLQQLASQAGHITCADINGTALQATIAALVNPTAQITPFVGDMTLPAVIDDLMSAALAQMGGVDVFIANAGFSYYERLDYQDWGRTERIFALNVLAPIYSAQAMLKRYPQGGYTMVLIASAMAYMSVPGYTLYAATKAAVDRFAEGYRFDLPPAARLMVVYPVATRTSFFSTAGHNVPMLPSSQSPQEVASAIVDGLKRDADKVYPNLLFRVLRLTGLTLQVMRWSNYWIGGRQFRAWLKGQKPTSS